MLRGKTPEPSHQRLKMLLYGDKGAGKTTAAIQFPNAYLIDLEKGSQRYWKTMVDKGSIRYETSSFDELTEEIRSLMTTKHDYKTLIVDPITIAYEDLQDKWMKVFDRHAKSEAEKDMRDYGMRYWGKVKFDSRGLRRLMTRLDMNIIATSHEKPKYVKQEVVGLTHDSDNKDGYMFDFVFRLERRGDKRFAITEKRREELGQPIFPDEFEFTYANFLSFYGKDVLEKDSKPVALATKEQVAKIEHLLTVVNIPGEEIDKWLSKAKAEKWSDLDQEQADKCIDYIEKKLKGGK